MFERFLSFAYICSSAFSVYTCLAAFFQKQILAMAHRQRFIQFNYDYGLQDILKVSANGRPARGNTPAHRWRDEWRTRPSVAWRNGFGQDVHDG